VLTTRALSKVSHRRKLGRQGAASIEAAGESGAGLGRAGIVVKLDVHIANQVITRVFTHVDGFHIAKLGQLFPQINVELFQMIPLFFGRHCRHATIIGARIPLGTLIQVGQQNGRRNCRLHVLSQALLPMATRTNLVVEGAVDLVLFSAKDGSKMLGRHC